MDERGRWERAEAGGVGERVRRCCGGASQSGSASLRGSRGSWGRGCPCRRGPSGRAGGRGGVRRAARAGTRRADGRVRCAPRRSGRRRGSSRPGIELGAEPRPRELVGGLADELRLGIGSGSCRRGSSGDLALDARDRDLAAREAERPAVVDELDGVVPALAEQLERARLEAVRRVIRMRARAARRRCALHPTRARRLRMMSDLAFAGLSRQAELVRCRRGVVASSWWSCAWSRIERFDGELNAFAEVYAEEALARGGGAAARAAVRRADRGQGRDGHRRAGDEPRDGRLARAGGGGLRGRAAAARRRRDRDRQDEDVRARAVAVHGVDHVGRHAQPVGHRPHAGRVVRGLGGGGRRGAGAGGGGRGRGGLDPDSRRRAAGCSGSSRTPGGCRARRTTTTAGTGCASAGSRARSPTPS